MKIRRFDLDDKVFLINPETGRWGISNIQGLNKLEQDLLTFVEETKKYSGINQLVLNSSNKCNLSCVYCSEKKHRNNCNSMSIKVGKRAVDIASESKTKIVFHGSEPIQNYEWIKEIVRYAKENDKDVTFCIQSNLVDVPEDFYDFIGKYQIGISISLDGTRELNDKTRKKHDGSSTYDEVLRNIKKLINVQGNVHANTVITPYNLYHLMEIAMHFEEIGISSWQTIPVISSLKHLTLNPIDLGNTYIDLFDVTFKRINNGKQKMKINNLSQYINSFIFINSIDMCRHCSSGTEHPLIAIDSNGKAYPCDYFWENVETQCGNIMFDSLASLTNNSKNLRFRDINTTSCQPCTWKKLCGGGCLAEKYLSLNSSYCETHNMIYEYLVHKMPELLKKGLIKKIAEWNLIT